MKRWLLFGLLLIVFVLVNAPLDKYLGPYLQETLGRSGMRLQYKTLRLALPAGLEARQVQLSGSGFTLDLDSVYVGLLLSVQARGCGGAQVRGKVRSDGFDVQMTGFDPSGCLTLGRLVLAGSFDGSLSLDGVSPLHPTLADLKTGHVELRTAGGTFSGYVPNSAPGGDDLPIGEWEFQQGSLAADYRAGRLQVREGSLRTDGVVWELLGASVRGQREGRPEVRVDFRGRVENGAPRGTALLGLMPKASQDDAGWHRFRVVGPVSGLKLIGLQ